MESKNKLHDYIATAYGGWIDYAARYIRRSKLHIEPAEVVNDILCCLLERDAERMEQMVRRKSGERTELDFFIMSIIKTSIYSPQSPIRYKLRRPGMCRLRENIPISDDVPQEWIGVDGCELAHNALAELDISDIERRVFIWKFFDGSRISKWPGPEHKRNLYRAYNRVLKKIIALKVRK